jgi:hypothetical protein
LIERTNKYLLDLRLSKWISQKQYESLCVNRDEVELAHLYYLPKAHKLGTPLRPIVSGLRHPTIKISKFLDDLLRPLFETMATETTVQSSFELIKQLEVWCQHRLNEVIQFCTIDVIDLYTMIPQTEGVLSLKKMLDHLKLKQISGLKIEAIIRLSRFVMKNNYFIYDGQYYQQIRGGAMGSPLTLTMANCYMYFFEQTIARQIRNSGGLYFRYIDDIFIAVNWPERHFRKELARWSSFDDNIKLNAHIQSSIEFLDVHVRNIDGKLQTSVYHKPSYEPYYLPYSSVHPLHVKENIPFTMIYRAIFYCSSFELYVKERESLRIALLMNKYPNNFIDAQFNRLLKKYDIHETLSSFNYDKYRRTIVCSTKVEQMPDRKDKLFVHLTYCRQMRNLPLLFHSLWQKYFGESPINDVRPVLGIRNVYNIHRRLVTTRASRASHA